MTKSIGFVQPCTKAMFYIFLLWFLFSLLGPVMRISPYCRSKNGSLVPIGHKGRFLLLENRKKWNGNSINRVAN